MNDRHPNSNAGRKINEWLTWCRENGWPKSAMGRLCDIWWEFHDDNGDLIKPPQASDGVAHE